MEGSGLIVVEAAYPGILVKGLSRVTVVSEKTLKKEFKLGSWGLHTGCFSVHGVTVLVWLCASNALSTYDRLSVVTWLQSVQRSTAVL